VISQGGSLVIIAAPTEPGSFPMCADGGPSTGIADLEADLGSRTIVVLQPRDGSADVECTIDDALSSACTSRRLK
jgi:hypothetical protein